MKLNIPFYPQSTSFTCDPACVMMVLKYFNRKIKLDRNLEFDIWRESYGIGIPGCMPQGLAYSALLRGLNAILICKKEGLIQVSNKLAQKEVKENWKESKEVSLFTCKELLKKSIKKGMDFVNKDPDLKDVEEALNNNQIPIVMIHMNLLHKEDSPHWIVVTGMDDGNVWINDPYKKRGKDVKVSRNNLLTMMNDLRKYSKIEKRMLILHKRRFSN